MGCGVGTGWSMANSRNDTNTLLKVLLGPVNHFLSEHTFGCETTREKNGDGKRKTVEKMKDENHGRKQRKRRRKKVMARNIFNKNLLKAI